MMTLVKDYAEQIRGVSYKPEDVCEELNDESITLLRANNITDSGLCFDDLVYVRRNKVKDVQKLQKGDVLICTSSGSKALVGKAAYVTKDMDMTFGAFCKVIRPHGVNTDYFQYFFQSPAYRKKISELAAGANINNIRNEHIDGLAFYLPDISTQQRIADTLDKVSEGIEVCRRMLGELDLMVKAKFGEMFGDPTGNSFNLSVKPMTEVCEIIDGDRGKNYPNADEFSDEGYCLFLNAKNVTASGFNFDNCMYITKEKDDILRKGKLSRGDVVLTTRGTIGNLAFYTSDIPYEHMRINSGMVILRMNRKIINEVFFIEQFKMLLDDIKQKNASGSAQPQLPISAMREINILLPDIEQQKIFSEFVAKSNKSRLTLQQVLSKIELEQKVLMQKYFG